MIEKLYPSTKCYWGLFAIFVCMFTPGYLSQLAIFPFILLLTVFTRNTKEFLSVFAKSILIVVLFILIIQTFIVKNEDSVSLWWFIHYSKIGLSNSLFMISKIIGISSVIIYFFQVTKTKDIILSLEQSGVPKKMTFVIASTIQLIPQMSALSQTITDAQKSRGIETEGNLWVRIKSFIPMLGPLVLSAIQQTEERVLTLESRGFSANNKKTSITELHKTNKDYFFILLCVVSFIVYLIWRF